VCSRSDSRISCRPLRAAEGTRRFGSRLDGGLGTVSSTSRSWRRARSSPGARLKPPAPDGVPVERLVGMGLVGPRRRRPVSGVWASVDSRPVPPPRAALPAPRALAAFFLLPGRGGFVACFLAALPLGVLAPAVFLRPPPLRDIARRPAPERFVEGVRFWPPALRLFMALRARLRVFFAMSLSLFSQCSRGSNRPSLALSGFSPSCGPQEPLEPRPRLTPFP
jgi:hypothetical protein